MNTKKLRSINVAYGKTVNLGNFESARIDLGISLDLNEKEDHEEMIDSVFIFLKEKVKELELNERRGK